MSDRSIELKLSRRLAGLPRSMREAERSLAHLSVLRSLGWFRSMREGAPVDAAGEPIPWYTYPALIWLRGFVKPHHSVFEFGAGHSTLWYARHAAVIQSVEHDAEWERRLRRRLPGNVALQLAQSSGQEAGDATTSPYVQAIHGQHDIVVIDGMERAGCAAVAPAHLKPEGVIVFDNSDRPGYAVALERLAAAGFARVDFVGAIAGYWHLSCTSVFVRDLSPFSTNAPPEFLGF